MRIAIVGAGAMGTLLGHGLSNGGHEVTAVDLPERIAQIRADGLVVVAPDGTQSAAGIRLATSDCREAGQHDVVFLATKSQHLPDVAQSIDSLTHDGSTVVTIQNGIPWWYLHGFDGRVDASGFRCLDPDGLLTRHVDISQVVGCVAYPAAMMRPDGSVCHVEGDRFPVGELDGSVRDRTQALVALFEDGGFRSRAIDDIRSEIWLKAWGAVAINPISALTRATMVDICTFDQTRDLIVNVMREVQDVAEALGATFRHTMEKRIAGAAAVGAHKTSMLQDVENRRELELDALMLSVLELAELVDRDVPTLRNLYACTALLAESLSMADAGPAGSAH